MRNTRNLALLVVVGLAACAAPTGDTLLLGGSKGVGNSASGSGGSNNEGPTGATAGTGDGSSTTGTGSSGGSSGGSGSGGTTIPSGDGGTIASNPDGGSAARAMFETLLTTFEGSCGPCHTQGTSNAPAYLGGADPYATIKAFPGIVIANPSQSVLLTKGAHEGPALADPLKTNLSAWLTAEAATIATGPAATAPLAVAAGANTIDLSKLGVAGVSLTFTAAVSGNVLTLSALTIKAPAASAIHLTYPIFYVNSATGGQTENDDLSNDDQTIAAGASAPLDTGLLIISGWATGDTLQVAFSKLATATAVDAGTGGCKNVASFTTNAVPAIQNNTCLNCHNTGGSGNAALDLSGLSKTPADDATACAQALSRINTTTPAQSDIILAPTGQVANHPYKNASANYTTMMETWIQAEK